MITLTVICTFKRLIYIPSVIGWDSSGILCWVRFKFVDLFANQFWQNRQDISIFREQQIQGLQKFRYFCDLNLLNALILTLLCFRHCYLHYKLNAPSAKPNLPFSRFIFVISDERFTAHYNFRIFPGKTGNNRKESYDMILRILAVNMTITTKCSLLYTRHSNFERQV